MYNLNKSKKIIVFSAVLVMVLSCTMVLMGAFAADSSSQMMPISTSSTKTDTINDRPHLTWEAVKELTEGRLSYPDIRASFYYKEIGSGLYIVSFPIEDAQGLCRKQDRRRCAFQQGMAISKDVQKPIDGRLKSQRERKQNRA